MGTPRNLPFLLRRASAYAMDLLAVYLLTMATSLGSILLYNAWKHGGDPLLLRAMLSNTAMLSFFGQAVHLLVFFSYFTIAHWYFGRTFGKWACGLQVTYRNGTPSLLRSLGRSLSYPISGYLTLGIGFLLPLFRADGRALHDIITETDVYSPAKNTEQTRDQAPEQAA